MREVASVLCLLWPLIAGHAILTIPEGQQSFIAPQGVKLQPFNDARKVANRGCGGQEGGLGNVRIPQQVFIPGQPIQVQWQLTIPHNADNRDTGVRIAMHYDDDDSFGCNILAGGLEGDPDFDPDEDNQQQQLNPVLSAGPDDAVANQLVSTLVLSRPRSPVCAGRPGLTVGACAVWQFISTFIDSHIEFHADALSK